MIQHSSPFADCILSAFQPTPRGVVGLVDDLLDLCRLYPLRLEFRDDRCVVLRLGTDAKEEVEIQVSKSVFRAVLARIAAICNEQHPQSVTPYQGESAITLPPPVTTCGERVVPPATCFVSFTNTPSDQQLELRPSR